ncbi:MAG: hypothetical protein N3E45_06305 [Oscillatoriaceae bacterium SKW80]|nr:hypothetical protein [Oscillatoriaceae bacterium SKYG93]MCX8120428.1 hypothetical protein [Oscillatoriaceae bacterium SKW80]MDW8452997.1 hypothetical protein [Oscillatoriaceae cyanobacterium SKYGB_i_bin93]HIK28594.1 hypothetical protein [Oscillatoriaceae cyanobacterium M7585_C2015_266]
MKFEINFYREKSHLAVHTTVKLDWMLTLPLPVWHGGMSHVNWVRAAYGLPPLPESEDYFL